LREVQEQKRVTFRGTNSDQTSRTDKITDVALWQVTDIGTNSCVIEVISNEQPWYTNKFEFFFGTTEKNCCKFCRNRSVKRSPVCEI
jgi:hypothetical protein